jgi:predicted TIM-barrel fold metal-dependent hydrolase
MPKKQRGPPTIRFSQFQFKQTLQQYPWHRKVSAKWRAGMLSVSRSHPNVPKKLSAPRSSNNAIGADPCDDMICHYNSDSKSSSLDMTEFCQAPDPHPNAPRLSSPPLATDTHLHIFGPAYPYIAGREYTPPEALPGACRQLFHTLGIKRAVLVQPSVYGEDNSCMLNSAPKLGVPTRCIVVIGLDTTDEELRRFHDAGARGVRFILAHKGGRPLAELERLTERINDMGWHVQFLLRPEALLELESRLAKLQSPFVIDHIGLIRASEGGVNQPAFQALLRLFRTGQCWVKFTGAYRISTEAPPYRDIIPLAQALVRQRPDRILWGSDWPHVMLRGKMPNTSELLDLLLEWVPDEKQRTQILVDNPEELFGF